MITLERFIQHHLDLEMPLPVDLGAFIISRVCRGLEYAHNRCDRDGRELGIVHRDISPKNVLINFEGVVKITDFGIAKALNVMEQDEQILMGRLEYMSPEQARRQETDRRSDLYSLGVLMYELLTGKVPSRGWGPVERLHKLGVAFPTPARMVRADLPEDLCAIVERALAPDPGDRFQAAGEMGYALEYHLYHEGYGPTNVTLGEYVKQHFSGFRTHAEETRSRPESTIAREVEQRAQTLYGDLRGRPRLPGLTPWGGDHGRTRRGRSCRRPRAARGGCLTPRSAPAPSRGWCRRSSPCSGGG